MSFNLFLTLRVFSDTGGIQQVCRTMCKALSDLITEDKELQVLSLCDRSKDLDERYLKSSMFKGFGYNRLWFGMAAIWESFRASTVILSHVHLIPIVFLLKLVKPQTKVILLVHGTEVWRALPFWTSRLMRAGVQIWSVSHFTAQQLAQRHGLVLENIKVLHNCLDPFLIVPGTFKKPQTLLTRYALTKKQPVLLLLSRINRHEHEKGYDQVINSLPAMLQEFPDLCYLMAGKIDEEERQRIEAILIKNNLQQHVKLIGFIPGHELQQHYLLADIFIMTSKKEGFGLVLIEAAACGRQLICGNGDGSKEAVLNGELGKVIDPDNPNELTNAIAELIKAKHDLKETLRIQQTCIRHFNYPLYKQKVKQLLEPNAF